jgi:hypothetical protein
MLAASHVGEALAVELQAARSRSSSGCKSPLQLAVGPQLGDARQRLEGPEHGGPVQLTDDRLEEGWHRLGPVARVLVRVDVQVMLPEPVIDLRELAFEGVRDVVFQEAVDDDVRERDGRPEGGWCVRQRGP